MQQSQTLFVDLSTNWTQVFGVSPTSLNGVAPGLRRIAAITVIRVTVNLPSLPAYNYVANSTLDPSEQDDLRRQAFNAAPGNHIQVRFGDKINPISFPIKNVVGGYILDLKRLLLPQDRAIVLDAEQPLELKLSSALGTNDAVQCYCQGSLLIDDPLYGY